MPEGMDEATIAFAKDLSPQAQPRDQQGKFIPESTAPEPMFKSRAVEGDPLTGDTRDGGEDTRLAQREREVADGRPQQAEERRAPAVDDKGGDEREDIWDILAEDEGTETAPAETDSPSEGEKYEVTADGEIFHVDLPELIRGYSREQTFHKRLASLNQYSQELGQNRAQLQQGWADWHEARRDYEEDVANMLPAQPDWDREFATDPAGAHAKQKVFATIFGKLQASQQARAQREQAEADDRDRQVQDYAVKSFSRFVMDNKIPDKPTLDKNLQSMRRTAMAAGFSEYEVATVYDPRMLTVLLKASKYDRMMAARPRAVTPGKGRTLTPGSATPLSGNGRRKGLDEALRQQASSGSLEATAKVFERIL